MRWIVILLLVTNIMATNYFVDNSVSNSGDGSMTAPWKTIKEALSILSPGDTLFIRGNPNTPRIYTEQLTINGTPGTTSNPIVIRPYGTEKVEIQYQDDSILKLYAGGYVLEDLIFNHLNAASDAIKIKSSYNVLRRCEIKNGKRDGIDLSEGDFNLVEFCTIHNFISGSARDAHAIVLDNGYGNVFRNNEIYDNSGDCIQIYSGSARWTEIIDNRMYTTLGSGSENAVDIKTTVGVKLIGNEMFGFRRSAGSQGNAVVIHHDADSIIMRENRIYDSNGGIRIGGNSEGQPDYIVIERNLVHDLIDEGQYSVDGYGIQFDGLSHVQMYNNTFANIPGPLFWIDSDGAQDVDIRNNLFYNTDRIKGSESLFSGTVIIDYNGWFNADERFSSEAHPITGNDPLFVDAANGNFHLQPGSPAIDAGDPAFGTNFPGGRIDLGAFEAETVTGIRPASTVSIGFELLPNYPNPFNPITVIPFTLTRNGNVKLDIFAISGEHIRTLIDAYLTPGQYTVEWDARNEAGLPVSSGTYLYRLQTPEGQKVRTMIFLK